MISRRRFNLGLGTVAFAGLTRCGLGSSDAGGENLVYSNLGPLLDDPNGLLDLPNGFSYKIISQLGDLMSDGMHVPDKADGMGCFGLDQERVALVRNHELKPEDINKQPESIREHKTPFAYDADTNSGVALPGGTSTLIYNLSTQQIEQEYLSLTGTIRNCAGGVTPWGSWLTCEESVSQAGGSLGKDHGYVFEVPASLGALQQAVPLEAMGRFNHEAAAVDPRTGIVYLTEDREDGLLYRFIPRVPQTLSEGGQLQALAIHKQPKMDTRNKAAISMAVGQPFSVGWVDLDNPESPNDDLRYQGLEKGAAIFARGEGIHWGDNELYFCCTSGGAKGFGQVMRYRPSADEGSSAEIDNPGQLNLFFESSDKSLYNFGDNLTVAPNGHLIICEDQYSARVDNYLRGITPSGAVYPLARLRIQTEPAGACFSPDGSTLFVNLYSPTKTLAITGPWGV